MPTYEYECRDCERRRDEFFKIADKPEVLADPCTYCGGQMHFIISAPLIEADNIIDTPWLKDFAKNHNRQGGKRNRTGGPPIESRTDYKKYLQDHDLRPTRGENLSEC